MNDNECPICLESLINKFIIGTPCTHIFCMSCFMLLKDSLCPICRFNLNNKKYNNDLKNLRSWFKKEHILNDSDFPPLQ